MLKDREQLGILCRIISNENMLDSETEQNRGASSPQLGSYPEKNDIPKDHFDERKRKISGRGRESRWECFFCITSNTITEP